MHCHYCGYGSGGHDANCPAPASLEMEEWRRGWEDGRAGNPRRESGVRYNMGYLRGESALEEAANGQGWSD